MRRLPWVIIVMAFLGGPLALRSESAANGSIRGRVDVRAERTANARPDTSGLGMAASREGTDRRRSVVYLETAPQSA
ncbi:MAG TPA: hypothetical protein VN716_14540, partial [Vicinamibacterales bacterium]|nr:hypothetical protein [Vicinamibacterales bacterium]